MYCKNCDSFFDERDIVIYEEKETGYRSERCPRCGSDWIEDSYKCRCCNSDITEDATAGLCDECLKEIRRDRDRLMRKYNLDALDELEFALFE